MKDFDGQGFSLISPNNPGIVPTRQSIVLSGPPFICFFLRTYPGAQFLAYSYSSSRRSSFANILDMLPESALFLCLQCIVICCRRAAYTTYNIGIGAGGPLLVVHGPTSTNQERELLPRPPLLCRLSSSEICTGTSYLWIYVYVKTSVAGSRTSSVGQSLLVFES